MIPFCDLRPCLTRLFSPRATPNGILLFSFAFPVCRVPFRPSQPERNFIFNTAYPPSARPFSPLKSPKENFIFNSAFPVCRDLFYPRAVPNGILFSHSTSIPPSAAARGSRAALQYFRSYRPPFTTRGTGSPNMPNTSNDRARNALCCAETEKFSRPQTLRPPQIGAQGDPATQDGYKKRIYPSARREAGDYQRGKWQQEIYYRGLSAGEGVVGVLYMDFRRVKGWRGYNNMELRKGWQGGY